MSILVFLVSTGVATLVRRFILPTSFVGHRHEQLEAPRRLLDGAAREERAVGAAVVVHALAHELDLEGALLAPS